MNDFNAIDSIAIAEAKGAVAKLGPDAPLEEKLRAAMRATRDHWLLSQQGKSEGREIRAACGAVCLALGEGHPDYERIASEHRSLAKLSAAFEAAQRGVPVDFVAMAAEISDEEWPELIGLMRIWSEVVEESKGAGSSST